MCYVILWLVSVISYAQIPIPCAYYFYVPCSHYDITMGNDIARDAHCNITMGNDIARDAHCNITMGNDIVTDIHCDVSMSNDVVMHASQCIIMLL